MEVLDGLHPMQLSLGGLRLHVRRHPAEDGVSKFRLYSSRCSSQSSIPHSPLPPSALRQPPHFEADLTREAPGVDVLYGVRRLFDPSFCDATTSRTNLLHGWRIVQQAGKVTRSEGLRPGEDH